MFHAAHHNFVEGNYIGTAADGTSPVPNGASADNPGFTGHGGIWIVDADHNTIGGATPGAGNLIAFNKHDGIQVNQDPTDPSGIIPPPDLTVGNTFSRNSIFSNTALGIDLVGGTEDANGVTADDIGDADVGPNNLKNKFGSVGSLSSDIALFAYNQDGQLFVGGSYLEEVGANRTETIEVFSSDQADASGFGEGQTYLGSATIVDGNGGIAVIPSESFGSALSPGKWITITLTDGDGNTSEFSGAVQVAPPPAISIANVKQNEGDADATVFTFTVTRTGDTQATSTVDFTTADGTATTSDSDYTATNGTLTFDPGQTTQTITVNVAGDTTVEPDETFLVKLSNPTNAILSTSQATGTITNDDSVPPAAPAFSINDVSKNEGDSGTTNFTFTVTRSGNASNTNVISYSTADGTATTADNDYIGQSDQLLTFAPGDTSKTITIKVNGDTAVEPDEAFFVNLSNPVLGRNSPSLVAPPTFDDSQGQGTILNDDAAPVAPTFSINDVKKNEGNSGTTSFTFTVTRAGDKTGTQVLSYFTQDGTATTADNDYVQQSDFITFAPGDTTKSITINVNGDTKVEADETFSVVVSLPLARGTPDGVIAVSDTGTGTIVNDDSVAPPLTKPDLKINDVSTNEGNSGTTTFTFTVTRTGDTSSKSAVKYATSDGSAKSSSDYISKSGTITFNANQTSKTITISVKGDLSVESDETFKVLLSGATNATISDSSGTGTIKNDDGAPPKVRITIGDEHHTETDKGLRPVLISVYLDKPSSKTVTVQFKTADGTAKAGSDYNAASGAVTFKPGQTFQTITVYIRGDMLKEKDETFFVNLTNASNATIADKQSMVTILNDD